VATVLLVCLILRWMGSIVKCETIRLHSDLMEETLQIVLRVDWLEALSPSFQWQRANFESFRLELKLAKTVGAF